MPPAARLARASIAWGKGVCALRMLKHLWRDRAGASLIEYTIMVAVITVVVVVGVAVAGAWAQAMWTRLLPLLG
jgi:Flp pilus assembly pilin Flp